MKEFDFHEQLSHFSFTLTNLILEWDRTEITSLKEFNHEELELEDLLSSNER